MMFIDEASLQHFLHWVRVYDPHRPINEADVEDRFVVPLFQILGYPDDCHRRLFPVPSYERARRGRPREVDHLYFASSDTSQQNADSALVIVEAKQPQIDDLHAAMEQAAYYGERMAPLFLVATNGNHLWVKKRHRFRESEELFNHPIAALLDEAVARQLFEQIAFPIACSLKRQLADPFTHEHYVHLMQELDRHTDLQRQIAQGDFSPSFKRVGQHVTSITPKAAIECDIPLAFGDGQCAIIFSSLLLRGLTCTLTHRQILEFLLTGLRTHPSWGARRFLQRTPDGSYMATLGHTKVTLNEPEALDLCNAVDVVCLLYRKAISKAENTLETWNYLRCTLSGFSFHGFKLDSVPPNLWEAMMAFAREFDCLKGSSDWYIFAAARNHIRIVTCREIEHVTLYPYYGSAYLPTRQIDVLYGVDADGMIALEGGTNWRRKVGPNGWWTASYTHKWLLEQFIPRVMAHNAAKPPRERVKTLSAPQWYQTSEDSTPLEQITTAAQLAHYLHQIQSWCLGFVYPDLCALPAAPLRPFYRSLVQIVKEIEMTALPAHSITYIYNKVSSATRLAASIGVEEDDGDDQEPRHEVFASLSTSLDDGTEEPSEADRTGGIGVILRLLRDHVQRIRQVEYEDPRVADCISSGLIAFVEDGTIAARQERLNDAIRAMKPLLELARFDERYILVPPGE